MAEPSTEGMSREVATPELITKKDGNTTYSFLVDSKDNAFAAALDTNAVLIFSADQAGEVSHVEGTPGEVGATFVHKYIETRTEVNRPTPGTPEEEETTENPIETKRYEHTKQMKITDIVPGEKVVYDIHDSTYEVDEIGNQIKSGIIEVSTNSKLTISYKPWAADKDKTVCEVTFPTEVGVGACASICFCCAGTLKSMALKMEKGKALRYAGYFNEYTPN